MWQGDGREGGGKSEGSQKEVGGKLEGSQREVGGKSEIMFSSGHLGWPPSARIVDPGNIHSHGELSSFSLVLIFKGRILPISRIKFILLIKPDI